MAAVILAAPDTRGQPAPSSTLRVSGAFDALRSGDEIGGDRQRRVQIELADQVEQQLAAGLAERPLSRFADDHAIVVQDLPGQAVARSWRVCWRV
ncbi:MAG: hypothetical protein DLM68_06385 [Hyphomicrobiales bacterium]|nr:MAG: hypothetical protein DLM68_06385 [Hyphomicrobiales bacterium]